MPLSQINSASIENASIAIVDLSATGTPSSTTFLRGDNTWATPVAASGSVVQVVNVQSGTYGSTTATIPLDNTIPQNTEGTEFFTLSITPTSATSKLLIQVGAQTAPTGAAWITIALFKDSIANALSAASTYQNVSTGANTQSLSYYMTAGSTSTTTFKLRYGITGGTAVINGTGGTALFNGTSSTYMTIMEIAA